MEKETQQFSDNINEQLKHDAPFAWFLRHNACQSPIFRLSDIVRLDECLTNFLHALQLSEQNGASLAQRLRLDDWGARFVLFWLGIESGNHDYCLQAADGIEDEDESDELAEAFAWFSALDKIEAMLKTLGDSPDSNPWVKRAAIRACQLNDISLTSDYLTGVLNSDEAINQLAVLDYIASQRVDLSVTIAPLLQHTDARVGLAALIATIYLPQPSSDLLSDFTPYINKENVQLKLALQHAFVITTADEAKQLVTSLKTDDYSPRIVMYAMGLSGLVAFIPELLALCEDEALAKPAGEALAMITGLDLEEANLSLSHGDYTLREVGDDFDETLDKDDWVSHYETDLPFPDAKGLTDWWASHQSDFQANQRYLAGASISVSAMQTVLYSGHQLQRTMAALHLAYLDKNQKIFQTGASSKRQSEQLKLLLN